MLSRGLNVYISGRLVLTKAKHSQTNDWDQLVRPLVNYEGDFLN